MADLACYNDLDKGAYLQAKQILLMAIIAKRLCAEALDADDGYVIECCENDARATLRRLADQAERRSRDPKFPRRP